MASVQPATFRFDATDHEYWSLLTGEQLPHITSLLERSGLVDTEWMTEESAARGQRVHQLCAQFDYGAIEDPASVVSAEKAYLLAYVKASEALRPTWTHIEVAMVHPSLGFAGRPDRCGAIRRAKTVLEIKSGAPHKAHGVQTALQCVLIAGQGVGLPAEHYRRLVLYVKPSGKFKLEEMVNRRDYDVAFDILRRYA
jgi:hypothetical protein